MKRLCLIIAFLFLFTQTAFALPLLVGQKVVYRGTVTGLRISAVDGTAFIDNAGATIPTLADGNHIIEIYDSAGRFLRGYLKAAGTSESLATTGGPLDDGEIVTDPSFDNAGSWACQTGWAVSGGVATATDAVNPNQVGQNLSIGIVGAGLYKLVVVVDSITSGTFTAVSTDFVFPVLSVGINTYYRTIVSQNMWRIRPSSGTANGVFSSTSIKKVTTPSNTGATIVSTKGGTTYNFAYKNASFTYNAASYYVVIKEAK